MALQPLAHPTADTLVAFGSGKLDDTTAERVLAHLEQCTECRQQVANQTASTPASTPCVPPELPQIPGYDVLRELGRGGMGIIYLARNQSLKREEVVKVINTQMLNDRSLIERFRREMQAAARLKHENIVTIYAAIETGNLLGFAMEHVEGEDLAKVVRARGPLSVVDACNYAQQVAAGLQHAYEKGLVHRDIKPQNLILVREGTKHVVKILDFGLAKATREQTGMESGLTGMGQLMGTPDYIAPEQARDAATADIRADIYSLGCTLYHLLAGWPPFPGKSLYEILEAHMSRAAKPLHQIRTDVSAPLAIVVARMMAKDLVRRYQTPNEVVQELAPFVEAGTRPPLEDGAQAVMRKILQAETAAPRLVSQSAKAREVANVLEKKEHAAGKQREAVARTKSKRWYGGALLGCVIGLIMVLIGLGAGGLFRLKTPEGILVIEVNEPNPDVFVDGSKVTVTWADSGKTAEVRVKPGTHQVEVKKDGFTAEGETVTIEDAKQRILKATLIRPGAPPPGVSDKEIAVDLGDGIKLELVRIEPGTFQMGAPDGEKEASSDEKPQHWVKITKAFYLGKYLVTQEQYKKVMGENPSYFKPTGVGKSQVEWMDTRRFPVEEVYWDDAASFLEKLNERSRGGLPAGFRFRLPTEAQWEYACRAGTTTPFHFGGVFNGKEANCNGNYPYGTDEKGPYLGRTTKVGSYPANAWGLYDMHCNVWEWCEDFYEEQFYGKRAGITEDPININMPKDTPRVVRGGSWRSSPWRCRAAMRFGLAPGDRFIDVGLRVCCRLD
jgi:formylglycine-generating enzyme required for sulfatase activity/serine/threonine protein kinase